MQTKSTPSKRNNIYLRRPTLLFAVQQAIKLGIIRAGSASEWIDNVLASKVKEITPKLRRQAYRLGLDEQALVKDGIKAATE